MDFLAVFWEHPPPLALHPTGLLCSVLVTLLPLTYFMGSQSNPETPRAEVLAGEKSTNPGLREKLI